MNMKFQKQKGSSSYYVYYIGVYMSTLKRKVVGLTILRICPDFYHLESCHVAGRTENWEDGSRWWEGSLRTDY